jgi:hypothetical protein
VSADPDREVSEQFETLAVLVLGKDTGGHFQLMPPPAETSPHQISELRESYVTRIYQNFST